MTPMTEAGRADHDDVHKPGGLWEKATGRRECDPRECRRLNVILAIEAEAAAKERERISGVAEALRAYVSAQSRMRDRWAEGDDAVKNELWRNLHACEEPARDALDALLGPA